MAVPRDRDNGDRSERERRRAEHRAEIRAMDRDELAAEHERLWALYRAGTITRDEQLRLGQTQQAVLGRWG
jgi:hypothetical protein